MGNGGRDDAVDAEGVDGRVIDGQPKINGDKTWLAELQVPRPGTQEWGGRVGSLCVRGPLRMDRKIAEDDLELFKQTHKRFGIKELQKVRSELRNKAWK